MTVPHGGERQTHLDVLGRVSAPGDQRGLDGEERRDRFQAPDMWLPCAPVRRGD